VLDGTYPQSLSWEQTADKIYKTAVPQTGQSPGLLIYAGTATPPVSTLQFTGPVTRIQPDAVLLQTKNIYCNFRVTSIDLAENRISGITFFRDSRHWQSGIPVEVRQVENGQYIKFSLNTLNGLTVAPQSLTRPGHWYWNAQEQAIYLYSDKNPATFSVEVGQKTTGLTIKNQEHILIKDLMIKGFNEMGVCLFGCRNITLRNIHVQAIGANGAKLGISLQNSSNCTVTGNTVEYVLVNGIGIYSFQAKSSGNKISANTLSHIGGSGISLSTDEPSQANLVHGNVINDNTINHTNLLAYDSGGIYTLFAGKDNVIQNNIIKNGGSEYLQSDGILIDYGTLPVNIINNTIENNSMGGIVVTGKDHRIIGNKIKNNGTGFWQSAQIMFFPIDNNTSNCTVRSNTVEAGERQKLFMVLNALPAAHTPSHDIDYNTYFSKTSDGFCWSRGWACDKWLDFTSWKNETAGDKHSNFSRHPLPSSRSILPAPSKPEQDQTKAPPLSLLSAGKSGANLL
jgi:parallel beta-helix repeat protein